MHRESCTFDTPIDFEEITRCVEGVAVGVVEPVDGYGISCAGGIGVAVEVLRVFLLAGGGARSRV